MPDGIETQNFASLLLIGDSSTLLRMTGRIRGSLRMWKIL